MNEQPNTPIVPEPKGSTSAFQVWTRALTKPNEQTYAEIANSPDASPSKAYLWIFLAALANFLVAFLVQILFLGSNGQFSEIRNLFGDSVLALLCIVPLFAAFAVLGFMISTGLIQWVAGLFKGTGTYSQLAYVLGAISAPATLISAVLSGVSAIPFIGLCLLPISILLILYVMVLSVTAVKGVNRFSWGQAIASYFLPTIVFFGVCLIPIILIAVMRFLGPAIGDTFSTIQNSLP